MTMRWRLVAHLFDVRQAAQDDAPAPGAVGLADALRADDDAAGGEVWAGDEVQQVFDGDLVEALVVLDQVI